MKNIRDLLEKEECVWLYLEDDAACEAFFTETAENGFGFGDLPRNEWVGGKFIALHADGQMGHLPAFIWHAAINGRGRIGNAKPCIDYRRFKAGDEDPGCREAHLSAVRAACMV